MGLFSWIGGILFGHDRLTGVAVCDLNGPYIPGDATYETSRDLSNKDILPDFFGRYAEALYKHCEQGKLAYRNFIQGLMQGYELHTKGKSKETISKAIDGFIKDKNIVPHSYANDFLDGLKEAGFRVAMLTSSPEEIAQPINAHLFDGKFDDLVVARHNVDDKGCYVELEDPIISEETKERRTREYLKSLGVNFDNGKGDSPQASAPPERKPEEKAPRIILGVGDRTNDWGIFKYSTHRLLLNPDREAYERAKKEQQEELKAGKKLSWFIYPDPERHLIEDLKNFLKEEPPDKKD